MLIASLASLAGLGRATLWEPDEPRFAAATRAMFERADFATPYLNGAPRFEKPILFYWLQAASFAAFGDTELGARVPAALAGVGTVLLLYLLGVQVASRRAALVAALSTATTFRFVTFARIGLTDMPVVFFIVAALYGFVAASTPPSRRWWLFAWTCVGLGMLTKGPVGLLPVAIWASYAALTRDRMLITRVRPVIGAALALAIALPWYALMAAQHGRPFIDFAIGHEIVERMTAEASFAPTRGVFYYVKIFPGDMAPWSALFVAGVAWVAWRWTTLDEATRRPVVFALAWFASVFLVFSLSRSKVPHYVLPAYPAASLLIGVFVDRLLLTGRDAAWWRLPVSLVAAVLMATAAATALLLDVHPPANDVVKWILPGVLAAGAAALAVSTWRRALMTAVYVLSGTLAIAFALIATIIEPRTIEPLKPMPLLAREAVNVMAAGAPLGLHGRYGLSSLVYYSRRHVEPLDDDETTVAFLSQGSAFCVMPASDFERLAPRLRAVDVIARAEEFNVRFERLIERRKTPGREWVLVGRRATPPRATASTR